MFCVKIAHILVVGGGFVVLFGSVFHLQGLSIVGPEASFMYSNPNWVTYGFQMIVLGVVAICAGLAIWLKIRR